MLIAIEGIPASGKTRMAHVLASIYGGVVYTLPNYELVTGRQIKAMLNEYLSAPVASLMVADKAVSALMLANQFEVAMHVVKDLKAGKLVLLDSYWPSTLALSGSEEAANLVRSMARSLPCPDAWLYLQCSSAASIARRPPHVDTEDARRVRMDSLRDIETQMDRLMVSDALGAPMLPINASGTFSCAVADAIYAINNRGLL